MSHKLLFVANTSWSIYNFRRGVLQALAGRGYEIVIAAPQDDYSDRFEEMGFSFFPITVDSRGMNPFKDFSYLVKSYQLYKKIKPDFIFHFTVKVNIFGTIAARLSGIPTTIVVSGAGHAFIKKGLLNTLVKKLYRLSCSFAEQTWFLNKEDRDVFLCNKIVGNEKVLVLPGEGINTAYFKRSMPLPGNDGVPFSFILSARLLWDKGIGVFVDAAQRIRTKYPNTEFQLLGFIDESNPNGVSRVQIDEWCNCGIVKYLGVTNRVQAFLEKAHCFVLPSYYSEGVPRTLLEAASLEMPIITTDNVGCRDVVDDGVNGYLCQVRNPNDLADKMEMILRLPKSELAELGRKGRQKMQNDFEEKLVVDKYFLFLDNFFSR